MLFGFGVGYDFDLFVFGKMEQFFQFVVVIVVDKVIYVYWMGCFYVFVLYGDEWVLIWKGIDFDGVEIGVVFEKVFKIWFGQQYDMVVFVYFV